MSGTVVSESVLPGWTVSLEQQIPDTCFQQGSGIEYRQGKTRAINSIYDAGLTDCHIQMLEQFEVKANLVVPILVNKDLWGLLIAHQCNAPRQWQAEELELLDQLAVQIAIAIQQATAYEIAQKQIKERQRIEKNLQKSEERFRSTFEQAAVGISHVSLDGQFVRVNQRFADITGYTQPELLTLTFQDITYPDDLADDLKQVQMLLAGEIQNYAMEKRYIRKDGGIVWIKLTVSLVGDAFHHPQYFISVIEDISQRKQAETDLHQSQENFRQLAEAVEEVFLIQNVDFSKTIYLSPGYERIWQRPCEDVYKNPMVWLESVYPEDRNRLQIEMQRVMSGGKCQVEYRIFRPNGEFRWILVQAFPVFDDSGKLYRTIASAQDITERKQAEILLQESEARFQAFMNNSPSASWITDVDGRIVYASQTYVHTFQVEAETVEDLIGTTVLDIYPQEIAQQFLNNTHQVAQTKKVLEVIEQAPKRDGTLGYFIVYKFPLQQSSGKFLIGGVAVDITERVHVQLALQELNQELETRVEQRTAALKESKQKLRNLNEQLAVSNAELVRATRLKDEFLANMSHELRTPLNAVLGMSEGLQDGVYGVISEKQRQALQTIERSGKHLLELINDILDLSKIEAGQEELNYTLIAISELCKSSLAFIKQQACQKRIQLEVKIPAQLPKLWLDERRIRQVLINLLNNAVKFTPEDGRITLEVTHHRLEQEAKITSGQDFVRIAVIDTGIGIAPENLNKLFQTFVQIDSALNRQYVGTGLGLALVKRLVEIHGGQVGVRSQLGVGSCFTVDLPCDRISECSPDLMNQVLPEINYTANETIKHSYLILLAEDNEANTLTISNYLEKIGHRIILAKNGQEAISLTKAQFPDLILMDIQMPVMDGLEAIKQIRLDHNLVNIPIIALTALAMPGDREKCLASGVNEYLSKPVKLKQLATTIQKLLTTKDLQKAEGRRFHLEGDLDPS